MNKLKKCLVYLLLVGMIFTFTGCNGEELAEEKPTISIQDELTSKLSVFKAHCVEVSESIVSDMLANNAHKHLDVPTDAHYWDSQIMELQVLDNVEHAEAFVVEDIHCGYDTTKDKYMCTMLFRNEETGATFMCIWHSNNGTTFATAVCTPVRTVKAEAIVPEWFPEKENNIPIIDDAEEDYSFNIDTNPVSTTIAGFNSTETVEPDVSEKVDKEEDAALINEHPEEVQFEQETAEVQLNEVQPDEAQADTFTEEITEGVD